MITENFASATENAIQVYAAKDLQPLINGSIITPGNGEYNTVRKIWNGMIDRNPAVIVRCINTNDIIHAVRFARDHDLLISVRGGGHNVSGNAVCNGGVMIDLSLMKTVKVYPEEKLAYVEMGATWGDFDKATQEYGLATTGGLISTTGVAGLTLGGGVGWLVRKYGLSCDNLIEAEVVTADGRLAKASLQENADLLWGLRGGGGNFGIVSSMKLRVHKVDTVLGGMIIYTRDKAKEVIQFYRQFIQTAPEELTLYAGLMTSPDGIPVVALIGCYCGDIGKGETVMKPIRDFGSPVVDLIQPIPYVQMQSLLDGGFPHGYRYYWKSGFLEDLSDESIDIIISHMASNPSPYSAIVLEYYGGAAAREPEGGTAYPHRQSQCDLVIGSGWVEKQDDEKNITWTRKIWDALQPYLSHKVYVNTLGVEGEERVREAYGDNYSRLAALKRKYDPDNMFRMNQNILPA
ncbi:FAD-binding oxidoreductase [Segetibacter koreensis]|uniref:FAD-binding oxidoreductase n=1 Tax=Segetibacter koreensis TaxID=398037 RepID=UPI00036662CC|nr:FAD-binding oxidoreductase [Segetibacter koreensis]